MKNANDWWNDTCESEAWIDSPAKLIEEIQRDAFRAGVEAGGRIAAASTAAHAQRLAGNLVLRIPEAIPRGLLRTAEVQRDLCVDPHNVERAWRQQLATAPGQQVR